MNEISLIHQKIQSLPDIDFSDPHTFIALPFPSPLRIPERFFVPFDDDDSDDNNNHYNNNNHNSNDGNKTTVRMFQYMGRHLFLNLWNKVQKPRFLKGLQDLYLYGPPGTGKSHLLAALVLHLIWKGKRVVYIANCHFLLISPKVHIQRALLFAFHNDLASCNEILHARDMDGLLRFVRNQVAYSLYIVIDHSSALDLDGRADKDYQQKVTAWQAINELRAFQRFIFSAPADQQLHHESEQKRNSIKTIFFCAGLSKVCPHLFNYLVSCSAG